ncbi:MAG: acyl-CoA synthetase [Minwuia sp.]|uniref:acyl-CoA synthetase n=1 Tax=Minwuia sp. TaxID=2493630 RepID=UPI003A87FEFF
MSADAYARDLDMQPANYAALSPLSLIRRTATVYPEFTAIIHGDLTRTWKETYDRCVLLGSALAKLGITKDDTVAIMCPNIPEMYEAHFGVAMAGAVLNPLNYRLSAGEIAFILNHGEAKVLITDTEFSDIVKEALKSVEREITVIDVVDPQGPGGETLGSMDYEALLKTGDPSMQWSLPDNEWDKISLNYTSGTTGNPKGVVYTHRGAYLNAINNAVTWGMGNHARYLWTLPMFHCDGWCFPWTVAAIAGVNICLRRVEAATIYDAIATHRATHLCGAPIVMQMITGASDAQKKPFEQTVNMMTAAAPPPASVLAEMAEQGFEVTHVYGLTETYGPCVVCAWKEEWDSLDVQPKAKMKARQGVHSAMQEDLMVADAETLQPVPKDGETMGEVFMRGNIVMAGYLKNPKASGDAFKGGWFHSGDLGVWHPDGYIELKDRSKDIIISGGENISSIEVEDTLYKHPAVAACGVVGKPDEKWGETPVAFIELKPGKEATADEIKTHCRDNLAHYKCPREVVFGEIPKTSTGKIQKFKLRDMAKG